MGSILLLPFAVHAEDQLIFEGDATRNFNARNLVIDKTNAAGDLTLTFGASLNEQLVWDAVNAKFRITDDLDVEGTLSGASVHTAGGNVTINGNGTAIFNVNETATNFRIASDSETNMFFVDGSNDRIGIGTSSPETTLDVAGTISGSSLTTNELNDSQSATAGSVLVSRTGASPEWQAQTGSMLWYIDGPLVTGTSQGQIVTMPFALTVKGLDLKVKSAPTGASIIVDINEGGTTLFSTRPEVDAGSTTEDGNHAFSDTSLAKGAEITIDIDQVGSGSAGSGLTIMLHGLRQ